MRVDCCTSVSPESIYRGRVRWQGSPSKVKHGSRRWQAKAEKVASVEWNGAFAATPIEIPKQPG
jgi:hypothetical protein